MKTGITNIVTQSFRRLVDEYGFCQQNEVCDAQNYSVDYTSSIFAIRVEKYRHEFYTLLYKSGNADKEISLFNLLAYLLRTAINAPVADYFLNELDIEERYRKQLAYITTVIERYLAEITDFFNTGDYATKFADIEKFMIEKYPRLYKRKP